jgi:hypothetical protein
MRKIIISGLVCAFTLLTINYSYSQDKLQNELDIKFKRMQEEFKRKQSEMNRNLDKMRKEFEIGRYSYKNSSTDDCGVEIKGKVKNSRIFSKLKVQNTKGKVCKSNNTNFGVKINGDVKNSVIKNTTIIKNSTIITGE